MGPSKVTLEESTWGGGNKRRTWTTPKNFSVDQTMVMHCTELFPNTELPSHFGKDSLCISMLWFTHSTFTANSFSLLLTNKISVFLFIVCKKKKNSVALVRERTIPTEQLPPVPTFAGRGVSRGQRNGSPRSLISVF